MTEIIESRNVNIKEKVVTLSNVMRLASIIEEKRRDAISDGGDARVNFTITCEDGSKFTSSGVDIFSKGSIVEDKRVLSVEMRFYNLSSNQEIDVSISHGNGSYGSYMHVRGDSSDWVNGVIRRLEDAVLAFAPQNIFLYKNDKAIQWFLSVGIGALYFSVIGMIPIQNGDTKPPDWVIRIWSMIDGLGVFYYVLKYYIYHLIGWWPAYFLMDKLKTLWPSIEIQIGPKHTLIEKNRRLWVSAALLTGALPLFLSFIYDVGKLLVQTVW